MSNGRVRESGPRRRARRKKRTGIDSTIQLILRLNDRPKRTSPKQLQLLPIIFPPTILLRLDDRRRPEIIDLGRTVVIHSLGRLRTWSKAWQIPRYSVSMVKGNRNDHHALDIGIAAVFILLWNALSRSARMVEQETAFLGESILFAWRCNESDMTARVAECMSATKNMGGEKGGGYSHKLSWHCARQETDLRHPGRGASVAV